MGEGYYIVNLREVNLLLGKVNYIVNLPGSLSTMGGG